MWRRRYEKLGALSSIFGCPAAGDEVNIPATVGHEAVALDDCTKYKVKVHLESRQGYRMLQNLGGGGGG